MVQKIVVRCLSLSFSLKQAAQRDALVNASLIHFDNTSMWGPCSGMTRYASCICVYNAENSKPGRCNPRFEPARRRARPNSNSNELLIALKRIEFPAIVAAPHHRLERWDRAEGFGLHPPASVKKLLLSSDPAERYEIWNSSIRNCTHSCCGGAGNAD